ncbi:MAG: molybdopterin-guanine dinucleotide biosynthesis protein B [Methanomicrobiales archaeon]|nr:molybdopterin-guanine dinucleotide biosynthesis protein B [Methanomicrobiales archaeon]
MRIIHVAGYSGTGKTRFITAFIEALRERGPVGVIKHIGHHTQELPGGKDTTLFTGAGAAIVIGIDDEKAMAAIRNASLADALALLARAGMAYAVIEGFKTEPGPKIVFGEYDDPQCVLRDPGVDEALAALGRFPRYATAESMLADFSLRQDAEGGDLVLWRSRRGSGAAGMAQEEWAEGVRVATLALPEETCVAVLAPARDAAVQALADAAARIGGDGKS